MIKKLPGETWKHMTFPGWKELRNCYGVSSLGRIASYRKDILKDGKLLRGSLTTGYRTLNLHRPGNKGTLYIHREVAKIFKKRPSSKHRFVIHINHNKLENSVTNLQWATLDEMINHQQDSPAKIAYKEKQANRKVGLKLKAGQVRKIKNILNDPGRDVTIK